VPPDTLQAAIDVAEACGSVVVPIGKLLEGEQSVTLTRKGKTALAPRLESERFAKDSWFNAGIDAYINLLLTVPFHEICLALVARLISHFNAKVAAVFERKRQTCCSTR